MTKRKADITDMFSTPAAAEAAAEPKKRGRPPKPKDPNERKRHLDRLMVDLPEGMKEELAAIAAGYDCTLSDLSAWLLIESLNSYHKNKTDLTPLLYPIRSLKARYGVELDYKPK